MQGFCNIYVFCGFVYPLFNIGVLGTELGADLTSQILLGGPSVSLKAPVYE